MRAGGHVFIIFSLNWVTKLPFSAESSTTFNLLFLVRMIVNWNGLSGAGEQNQLRKIYYQTKKNINTKTKQLIQSKYTVLDIACVPAVDEVVWKMTRDLFVMWTAMWIITLILQIWEDWKCYRTHTCKVYCTSLLQISLLKVSLTPGFHTSVISPEFICCYPWEKTQKNATAMDKK